MKWHYDFKPTIVVITLLLILSIPLTIISMFLSRPALVVLDTDRDGRGNFTLSVESSGRPVPIALDRIQEDLRQKERGIIFHVRQGWQKVGTVFLTLRQIENKDIIYFLDYEPRQPGLNLKLIITANEADSEINAHQIEYPNKINNTSSRWGYFRLTAQTTSTQLPNSPLILDSQTHYLRLGPAEVFKPLANGVRLWLPEESGAVFMSRVTPDHLRFTFDIPGLPGGFTETWGILSADPLINWHDPKAAAAALTADLASYRKLAKDGFYYLTPTNYNPTAESAFWLNPAYHVGELFRRQKAGRYFSDISISSMYSALNTQAEGGFWLSSPSSDWLNSEYGLAEGFFDTRFSTDAAIFLLHMYQQTGEKKALTAAARFAAALRAYTADHGIPTSGGGVLVPDYFKPGTKHSQTHVSLNHLVTEMNFLFEMFLEKREPADLEVGNQIRQSVRDTGAKWIRENGDLHYAYLPDGSFGMQDYPLLTLKDLRLSQQLIYKLTGSEDEVFALLIKAKEDYLRKNNLPTK